MVANRTYGQRCPVSCALDIVGERWTLLIVRDLGLGLRRFSELQAELDGISPSLLADRLRKLRTASLVERQGDGEYGLTARGEDLLDVIHEIGRWGVGLMGQRDRYTTPNDVYPRAALGYMVRSEALPETALTVHFRLDDRLITLSLAPPRPGLRARRRIQVEDGPGHRPADVRVTGTLSSLTLYRQGRLHESSFERLGLVAEGPPPAVEHVKRIFSPG